MFVDSPVYTAVECAFGQVAEEAPGLEEAGQQLGVVAEQAAAAVVHHRNHSLHLVGSFELDIQRTYKRTITNVTTKYDKGIKALSTCPL